MPYKKVLLRTKDYSILDNTMDYLTKRYTDSTISISRVRIEDNQYEIVLSLNAEAEDIVNAISFLKQTPSIRLEEV
ncbi:MAG: hypothetical protein N3A62_03745 [Thermodesulfovibrionales bacterium]|nr:hypothetical protein [Thermodesulfovibrionales bacterium]